MRRVVESSVDNGMPLTLRGDDNFGLELLLLLWLICIVSLSCLLINLFSVTWDGEFLFRRGIKL